MPLREHLATLARYNLWATRKLYEHIDALPKGEPPRNPGAIVTMRPG